MQCGLDFMGRGLAVTLTKLYAGLKKPSLDSGSVEDLMDFKEKELHIYLF